MSSIGFIVPAGILLAITLIYLYGMNKRKILRRRLKAAWGTSAALRKADHDQIDNMAEYYRALQRFEPVKEDVDDITWRDLNMDEVFSSVDCSQSVVGSEVLYANLRRQNVPHENLMKKEDIIELYRVDEQARLETQEALSGIGRASYHGAARYLFSAAFQYPPRRWLYKLLAIIPLVILAGAILYTPVILGMILSFGVNIFVFYRTQALWEKEMASIRHIGAVLHCAQRLGRIKAKAFNSTAVEIRSLNHEFIKIRFWLPMFDMRGFSNLEMMMEYIKIIFMLDMISLSAIVDELNKHADAIRRIYYLVGQADVCQLTAQLREREAWHCIPCFHEGLEVCAQGLRHPLLKDAVPNSIIWNGNALITGSNASGKSTFIKALAVNCILAQTIHTCFAQTFTLCKARVMSSMAIRDDIMEGESYFIAEIKSLKRILDVAQERGAVLCFVDEILRGTNTIERIAASSAVLGSLAGLNMLCIIATHDIELTRLLSPGYRNLHFSEKITEEGVQFDYLLHEGPTRTRNAILLLRQMGFPPPVIEEAEKNLEYFEREGVWPKQSIS